MRGRAIAWVPGLLCLGAVSARADVWEQMTTSATPGSVVSSGVQYDFAHPSGEDQICFDDFYVTFGYWIISEVQAFGATNGTAGNFASGGRLIIQQNPSVSNPGTIWQFQQSPVSVLNGGNPLFSGLNLYLFPGHYWMGIYLKSNNPQVKWRWKATDAFGGYASQPDGPAIAHNPMGSLTGTTDPVQISELVPEHNLAFRITIAPPWTPEPATWVVLASASVLLFLRRRKV